MRSPQSGITLVELVVTLAVLAILATVGVPGLQALVAQNRASSAANELLSSLQVTRSAAISRAQDVMICPGDPSVSPPICASGGQWADGWLVIGTDEGGSPELIRAGNGLHSSVSVTGADQWSFSNTGTLEGQSIVHFSIQTGAGDRSNRTICMSLGGNARVIRGDQSC